VAYEAAGNAQVVERDGGRVRLRAGAATVELTALAPDLVRVGFFPAGRPVEYRSEAIAREELEAAGAQASEAGGAVELAAGAMTAEVALDPLRIGFSDPAGRGFVRELTFAADGGAVRMEYARGEGERFFGCGERTAGLEKTGSEQVFWNVDPPMGHTADLHNLYTSIPFVVCMQGGRAHGLFVDNPGRQEWDLAKADPSCAVFDAARGDLVVYVFAGPTPRALLERYTELTGRIALPPLWALGNQQSRWSYMTADEVREIARGFRERDIPCDVLYLDIDFMDGYRVFTWNEERFPDPAGLIAELGDQGFRVVTITDPGVKVDEGFPLYVEGRKRRLYCLTREGAEFRNVVWPGLCAFPDFTNPETRAWWGDSHAPLLDAGVAAVWCDMNEPSLFVPLQSTMPGDVVHPGGGHAREHAEVHNVYGMLMARAAREGLERLRPERRALVITRAGYAGLQRHAMQWTGDNSSWWEHLWMALPQLQNMGLSGVAFCGVDVGGFFGDSNGELLARFTEFGVFQPYCRNHSAMGTVAQEPWAFGEPWETICRDMIRLRMRLLPYLYGLFEEAARTGAPVLRPLLFEHPDDETTYTADDQFLFGDALLVAPITRPGIEHRHVYLPAGTWVHWWTGERLEGPAHLLARAPLGRPALYARANAPVPLWPVRRHVGDGAPDPLTLRIACAPGAAPGEREVYEDEGEGFGDHVRWRVACESDAGAVTVRLGERSGGWSPPRRRIELELRGLDGAAAVIVDGAPHDDWRAADGAVTVVLPDAPAARTVVVQL
jgi:alpha-glucosidase